MNAIPPVGDMVFSVQISFRYVLILEWLAHGERTGENLFKYLGAAGIPTQYVRCRSSLEVCQALLRARGDIPELGIPAIHIEAHGGDLPEDGDEAPIFGSGGTEPDQSMKWADLGELLAPINEAADFQLLLVCAACWGQAAIAAMNVFKHPVPFAACVGFTTGVGDGSLREMMRELYRALLIRKDSFDEAVVSARQERRKATEELQHDTSLKLGYQILRLLNEHIGDPDEVSAMIGRMRDRFLADGVQPPPHVIANYPQKLREFAVVRCEQAWNTWFPQALQLRIPSYRLKWDLVKG